MDKLDLAECMHTSPPARSRNASETAPTVPISGQETTYTSAKSAHKIGAYTAQMAALLPPVAPSPSPLPEPPISAVGTLMEYIMQTKEGEWIPFCAKRLKPREGLEFANLEEYEKFNKSYAHHVGFRFVNQGLRTLKKVVGRDPEKLTLVSKGIQNILKEVKDLNGSTHESKVSELESFIRSSAPDQINSLPPK
ncbi:hypothetical protein Cgig2_025598 [Carnegiea gigantea]|uniref:Uncharacterized protein n=1 Tax=Carnegiea gigantea TaxID=171969 RepID=A0A9Q1GQK1_9CARY|nr:hypothetical protein Cgig2_025598 [Carnegiea gigantea]